MAGALGALALAGGAALWRSGARPGREAAHEATGDGGVAGSTPEAGAPPATPAGTAGAEAPEASSAAPERPRPEVAGPGTGPQEATPALSGAGSPPMAAGRPRRAPAGEGSLRVNALPWASVWIDDRPVGDTPLDARVPAGRHRLRAEHPTLGSDETVVNVTPGGRVTWLPKLKR